MSSNNPTELVRLPIEAEGDSLKKDADPERVFSQFLEYICVQWLKNYLLKQALKNLSHVDFTHLQTALTLFFLDNTFITLKDGSLYFSEKLLQELTAAFYVKPLSLSLQENEIKIKKEINQYKFSCTATLSLSLEALRWQGNFPQLIFSLNQKPQLVADGTLGRLGMSIATIFTKTDPLSWLTKTFPWLTIKEDNAKTKLIVKTEKIPVLANFFNHNLLGSSLNHIFCVNKIVTANKAIRIQLEVQGQISEATEIIKKLLQNLPSHPSFFIPNTSK